MKICEFKDEKKFIQKALKIIKKVCNKRGIIRIALSGGSTPQKVYKALSKSKTVPFERVEFYQVDERYVSKNHKESNQKMIKEKLIIPSGKSIAPLMKRVKTFHFFDTSLPIEKSLRKYEKQLPEKGFDLVILGIGTDGHTASLFPHASALKTKKLVAHTTIPAIQADQKQLMIKDRITITFPTILKSRKILVLIKGREKSQILKDLQNPQKKQEELQAKALLKHKDFTVIQSSL